MGKFPQEWKKANVVPVHKKNDKQPVKIFGPISLLPICGKIYKELKELPNNIIKKRIHAKNIILEKCLFHP